MRPYVFPASAFSLPILSPTQLKAGCLRALGFQRLRMPCLLHVSEGRLLNSIRLLPVPKLHPSGQSYYPAHSSSASLLTFLRLLTCLPLSKHSFFLQLLLLGPISSLSVQPPMQKTLAISDLPIKQLPM